MQTPPARPRRFLSQLSLALRSATVLSFATATVANATTWHVNADGSGDATTIAAGVLLAASGDTVEVACGAYAIHNVVLPVDLVLRSEQGAAACAEITTDVLARHLQVQPGITVTIEGFAFRGGIGYPGGSVFVRNAATATIRSCDFEFNRSGDGGAIFAEQSSHLRLEDCGLRRNIGGGSGGAVSVSIGATFEASNCEFADNGAPAGGGLHGGAVFLNVSSQGTMDNCQFRRNTAQVGGGIAARFAQLTVENSLFERNSATPGYGYVGVGGGVSLYNAQSARIASSVFEANSAPTAGGMHAELSGGEMVDCTFRENTADRAGGFRSWESNLEFQGCYFLDNLARAVGGLHVVASTVNVGYSVFAGNHSTGEKGGGILSHGSTLTLDHVTLHGNESRGPGSNFQTGSSEVNIFYSIITGGRGGIPVECSPDDTPPTVRCSNIFGNEGGDWTDCIAAQASIHRNFSADPLYCAPDIGVFALNRTSPCAPPGLDGCGQVGALGAECGPVSITAMSWGRAKSLFR